MNEPGPATSQRTPVRRRVAPSRPERQGRRGYLWVGGVLGVIVGVLFVIFAAGPILRYFFGEANVEPGGAYDIRGLRMEPLGGVVQESAPPVARLEIEISLDDDHDPFVHDAASWELELTDGVIVPADSAEPSGTIAGGETVTVVLEFTLPGGQESVPELLRLDDPRTRFEVEHFFEPAAMSSDELRPLPLLLRPGLRLAFIGYNPGITSARLGHYYAYRGNVFWRHLGASGLVGREVSFEDDARLQDEAGIGFTDLCRRPSLRASELTPAELAEGAARLHSELLEYQPEVAVFSGKGIYQHYGRHALGLSRAELARLAYGPQPQRIGRTVAWVIPSSSGLASKWHGERLALLQRLARELDASAENGEEIGQGEGEIG